MTMTPRPRPLFLLAAMACVHAASCTPAPAPPAPAPGASATTTERALPPARPPEAGVVATVNGVPIGAWDVSRAMTARGHEDQTPANPRQVLETLIRNELAAQRAVALGLHEEPGYVGRKHRLEAELNALRWQALPTLFYEHEVDKQAQVTDAAARAYYDEHAEKIRTDIHVWQILRRTEAEATQELAEIRADKAFEEVARAKFDKLPPSNTAPWDLGFLKWQQVPPSWRPVVYGLAPGEISDIIRGPAGRFWIVKLIEKRDDPEMTFERVKPTLDETFKADAIRKARADEEETLRKAAHIVYYEGPLQVPEPDDE